MLAKPSKTNTTTRLNPLRWSLLCALLLASASLVHSAEAFRFTPIPSHLGLSATAVLTTLEDRQGFIWIGTQHGLNRYDGYTIKRYQPTEQELGSISGRFISALMLDTAGFLWIGTRKGGLNRFDPDLETFTSYLPGSDAYHSAKQRDVSALIQDHKGVIWTGTADGVYLIDPHNLGRFTRPAGGRAFGLFGRRILHLFQDSQARLWVSTEVDGLVQASASDYLAGPITYNTSEDIGQVQAMAEDGKGQLWAGSEKGLFYYRGNSWEKVEQAVSNITALYIDPSDRLWAATRTQGLISIAFNQDTQNEGELSQYLMRADKSATASIYCLNGAADGALWVGTDSGLGRLDLTGSQFGHYRHEPNSASSLSQNKVQAIVEDHKGGVWVGTQSGGLNHATSQEPGIFRHFRYQAENPVGIASDHISALLPDARGLLWVGTHDAGLQRISLTEPISFKHFPSRPGGLSNPRVQTLYLDAAGFLWVGTQAGLNRLSPGDALAGVPAFRQFRAGNGQPNSLRSDNVTAICEDSKQPGRSFWIGTQGGGLNKLSLDPKPTFRDFPSETAGPNSGHHVISAICPATTYQLWLGTPNGLSYFDCRSEQFTRYRLPKQPLNQQVFALQQDEAGLLWLSTSLGLFTFDSNSQRFNLIDILGGSPGIVFYSGTSFSSQRDDKLYFSGAEGYSSFYPSQIKAHKRPSKSVITQLLLYNEPVRIGQPFLRSGSTDPRPPLLDRAINLTDHLVLRSDDSLSLQFAALHYENPARNSYAYMLAGYDNDWIYTSAENRVATYTKLSPDTYEFRLKAANQDGLWSKEIRQLTIIITAPIWWSGRAKLFYLLIATGIFAGFARRLAKTLQKERNRLIRHNELDKCKDQFLANTSHELRTPLNGIIGLAESLLTKATTNPKDATKNDLALIISCGKRLMSLINDILDSSKLRERGLHLELETVNLCTIVEQVLVLSKPLATDKNLLLVNDIETNVPSVLCDKNRLAQILHNLIGNAVKFTERGSVRISATRQGHLLSVSVTDTGRGIPSYKLDSIFVAFEQNADALDKSSGTGLGLSITRELLTLMGGAIQVESEPGVGATFSFTLPISGEQARGRHLQAEDASPKIPRIMANRENMVGNNAPHTSTEQTDPTTGYRLLIVDDEPVNRQIILNHLEAMPYQLKEASSGPEALNIIDNGWVPDLVLLDIMMPQMTGYKVCQRIRESLELHELPIIFLTARSQDEDLAEAFRSGGNDYLTKPFSSIVLLSRTKTQLQLLKTNRDLSQALKQILDSEKMASLGQMVAGMTHEVNTPLGVVSSSASHFMALTEEISTSFQQRTARKEDMETYFSKASLAGTLMLNNIRRATELMQSYKLVTADQTSGQRHRFNLKSYLGKIIISLNPIVGNRHKIIIHCDEDLELDQYPGALAQVVTNLVANSLRHAFEKEQQGHIQIVVNQDGKMVEIRYKDDGKGIPAEDVERVFEPFFTRARAVGGTGLGLHVVAHLTHHTLKGSIRCESKAGEGAVFLVRFPKELEA